jgi:hypothetical protein
VSYIEEVKQKEKELFSTIEEEQIKSLLKEVIRPDGAKEALGVQYEHLDSMNRQTLERYIGALSQYLIYLTKYINMLGAKKSVNQSVYNRKLSEGFFRNSEELKLIKTIAEKEIFVKRTDPGLLELQDKIELIEAKLALYKDMPETINNLIQTIKKVYDARIKEFYTKE